MSAPWAVWPSSSPHCDRPSRAPLWQRGERRPRLHGRRLACHGYHPELSGAPAPPNNADTSSPAVILSIHPIGGFAHISRGLPLQQQREVEVSTHTVAGNGLNAQFDDGNGMNAIHCIASEPHASFLRVSVTDGGQEVAYETLVLARLRSGYRTIQLRSVQDGTRIELAYLFVRIAPPSSVRNRSWVTSQQVWAYAQYAWACTGGAPVILPQRRLLFLWSPIVPFKSARLLCSYATCTTTLKSQMQTK